MTRSSGPFDEYYYAQLYAGTDGASLREAAREIRPHLTSLRDITGDLHRDRAQIRATVSGAPAEGTEFNATELIKGLDTLTVNCAYAVGVIALFANDVEAYDDKIESYNSTYNLFALLTLGNPALLKKEERRLRRLAEKAQGTLETDAGNAATMLGLGPSPERAKTLFLQGYLPLSALSLWPGLEYSLTDAELRRATRAQMAILEQELRERGLLTGELNDGYRRWLHNVATNEVDPDTIAEIIEDHDITPESFEILDAPGVEEIRDRDGKSFFTVPPGVTGEELMRLVQMTYVINAGTGYGTAQGSANNDFEETPYSSAELQRIIDRQQANHWTYDNIAKQYTVKTPDLPDAPDIDLPGDRFDVDVPDTPDTPDVTVRIPPVVSAESVHDADGRMVTTPNGMLMGLGGGWRNDVASQQGGTTYGDVFLLNIDRPEGADAEDVLRDVITKGDAQYEQSDGSLKRGSLDLDRLLHHEERHSQQWADKGYFTFLKDYAQEQATGGNETEEDAGLSDGGY